MDGWKRKKVKHLGTVYSGSTPSTDQIEYWNGSIEWITPNDLSKNRNKYFKSSERKITQNGLKYSSAILLPAGSLVVSSRAPIGYLTIPQTEFTTNQGCKSIVFNSDNDVEFQYYNFQYNIERLKQIGEGTTFSEVSKKFLENFELDCPLVKTEQTRIAEILTTVDNCISQTNAVIKKCQCILSGLMQDLLTKGIDDNGNVRSEASHLFITKKGLSVPESWDVKTVGEISLTIDPQPDHRTPGEVKDGVPYVGISDFLFDGSININKCRRVSAQVFQEHKERYTIKVGDIIFGKIGTIGAPKQLPLSGNYTLSANVILIQPFDTPSFFYWMLRHPNIQREINNTIHTTTQPAFGMQKIRALKFAYPGEIERKKIGEILNAAENDIKLEQLKLSKLQLIKTGLMQDLLTGKVKVPENILNPVN